MKKTILKIACFFLVLLTIHPSGWIRINQMGYKPEGVKIAVLISKDIIGMKSFEVVNFYTDETAYRSTDFKEFGNYGAFETANRLYFTDFKEIGVFYIRAGGVRSPLFRISENIYDGSADFVLNYMRQQRCGFNPFLNDSCHTQDGYIIYHPELDSTFIDVTGGWHDASDYLQYVTTSANAAYQMLFAYERNPGKFSDLYDSKGVKGSNGIPDILDEAIWGIKWLMKMNPSKNFMFNQIADDRDHQGFRLPNQDSISYGKGLERPVYFCTGQPQGVFKYLNRTTGIASTAGKFASTFALASKVLSEYAPELTDLLLLKAIDAYNFGELNPGVCQTAPCRAPYFYEEDNWTDDMELAAAQLSSVLNDEAYLIKAAELGRMEIRTPWFGSDSARHYQWYPFMNLGHYRLAASGDASLKNEFSNYLRSGIEAVYDRAKNNPFQFGVPFIWCSNNLVSAIAAQCRLYREITGNGEFIEMEASLIDWLFGCNPWGISMIIGLPEFGKYPLDPHSAFTHLHNYRIDGGLIDGPVYSTIFDNLKGVTIYEGDEYAEVQPGIAVYHDDWGDYSTNEPTMDGTASLSYLLSSLESGETSLSDANAPEYSHGALIRTDKSQKRINLIFSGHQYAGDLQNILNALQKRNLHASFFFTGDFYRNPDFRKTIIELKKAGHYLGAHSDKHLLYASWRNRDSLLISKEEFYADIKDNYAEMRKFEVSFEDARFFLPPFEWHNKKIAEWCAEIGLTLINFSPGTKSTHDWTTPDMAESYHSSEAIFNSIIECEEKNHRNLNGFILLLHAGADPLRTDTFGSKLDRLLDLLTEKGYQFNRLDETIH